MRQIGRLGSGIVEIGAVKRLKFWYWVYNQSKTEKNDGISDKKRLLKPWSIATYRGEWGKKSRGLKVSMAVMQNLEVIDQRQLVFFVL